MAPSRCPLLRLQYPSFVPASRPQNSTRDRFLAYDRPHDSIQMRTSEWLVLIIGITCAAGTVA